MNNPQFYIFGVPDGFDMYNATPEKESLFNTFYDSECHDNRRMAIHRNADNSEVSYIYLRYNLLSCNGRPASFLGMSLTFSEGYYCADFPRLLYLFEEIYSALSQDVILTTKINPSAGQGKYTIRRFAERMAAVIKIEEYVRNQTKGWFGYYLFQMDSTFRKGTLSESLKNGLYIDTPTEHINAALKTVSWLYLSDRGIAPIPPKPEPPASETKVPEPNEQKTPQVPPSVPESKPPVRDTQVSSSPKPPIYTVTKPPVQEPPVSTAPRPPVVTVSEPPVSKVPVAPPITPNITETKPQTPKPPVTAVPRPPAQETPVSVPHNPSTKTESEIPKSDSKEVAWQKERMLKINAEFEDVQNWLVGNKGTDELEQARGRLIGLQNRLNDLTDVAASDEGFLLSSKIGKAINGIDNTLEKRRGAKKNFFIIGGIALAIIVALVLFIPSKRTSGTQYEWNPAEMKNYIVVVRDSLNVLQKNIDNKTVKDDNYKNANKYCDSVRLFCDSIEVDILAKDSVSADKHKLSADKCLSMARFHYEKITEPPKKNSGVDHSQSSDGNNAGASGDGQGNVQLSTQGIWWKCGKKENQNEMYVKPGENFTISVYQGKTPCYVNWRWGNEVLNVNYEDVTANNAAKNTFRLKGQAKAVIHIYEENGNGHAITIKPKKE